MRRSSSTKIKSRAAQRCSSDDWRRRRRNRPAHVRRRPCLRYRSSTRRSASALSGTSACSPVSRSRSVALLRFELVLADHDRGARIELVRALHAAREIAAKAELDGEAARGAARARARSAPSSALSPTGMTATGRGGGWRLVDEHRQALDPAAQPTPARRRPAHRPRSARHSARRPAPYPGRRVRWS